MVRVSAVSPQNRQGFSCNSVGLNRGGYKQNTELTTGGDTAEGNINEVATKGGTGYRGAAMFPSGRKKSDKREKGKNPAYRKSGRQLFTNGWFLQKDMAQPKERDRCKKGNAAWQEWKIIPFLPVSSKFCHDYPMLENLFLITGTSLADP